VCQPEGCLHEVYLVNGDVHRLVFRTYARDIKMTNDGGMVGLVVLTAGRKRFLVWRKDGFMDVRHEPQSH
jgi:hypothetical protein